MGITNKTFIQQLKVPLFFFFFFCLVRKPPDSYTEGQKRLRVFLLGVATEVGSHKELVLLLSPRLWPSAYSRQ